MISIRQKPPRGLFFKNGDQGRPLTAERLIKDEQATALHEAEICRVMQGLADPMEEFGFHCKSLNFKKIFWTLGGEWIRANIK